MTVESFHEREARSPIAGRVRALTGRPLRYILAGGLNTLVGFAAYPALLWVSSWFREHYLAALLVVQLFCVAFAFTTYKVAVFRSRGSLVRDFVRFASYYAGIFAVNWVVLPLFVEVVGIKPIVTQTVFNVFVVVFGYFWHSNITFKPAAQVESMHSAQPGTGSEAGGKS
jgi:putative flippase GtrA